MKHDPRLSRGAEPPLTSSAAEAPRIAGPRVEILLRLFDNSSSIGRELQCIAEQTHQDWSLSIRDDGSRDDSLDIAGLFAAEHPRHRVRIWSGAHKGMSRSVLALLAESDPGADYLALCPEGGLTDPVTIARALARLSELPPGVPALFVAPAAALWRHAIRFRKPPGFRNALVETLPSAGPLVANRAAANVLRTAAAYRGPIPDHVWWIYQVVTGAGGTVILDGTALRFGRRTPLRPARRARRTLVQQTSHNIAALMAITPLLTRRSRETLMDLAEFRVLPLTARLKRFRASGLHRQTRAGQAALWAAVIAGSL